ncbi:MAG: HlyD family type I secretion periplasmic adaptor subunit [Hyphomicrobiales bacterium]|nr:HlyD family type I secretion periplasmic adaptor subunit [Hyphomicrobiales bacterium]
MTAPRLDTLLGGHPIPTWRPLAWIVMLLLTGALAWAYMAQLEEVAVASGEVVPQGKLKVIQHLEGGIIEELYVQEGDTVKEGQPLAQLDLGSGGTNREELQVRLDGLLLDRAKLEAEAHDKPLEFPKDVAERRPSQVVAQRQAFDARQRELESSLNVLKEQARQRELDIRELEARERAVNKNLKLAQRRFAMSKSLLADGLTSKMEHLTLEAEVESMEGERQSLAQAVPKARAALAESRQRLAEGRIRFQREAQDELGKTVQSIDRIMELLSQADKQDLRTEIKSPIDGVVKNMRYNTIGGVVRPGEPIMEIVPTGENLVVEAKLSPTDRGYVTEGQPARVKISTYDFVRYGSLDGTVIRVAPDSTTDQSGMPFFRVIIETKKTFLGKEEGKLPIVPGMQAIVDIRTGRKSVLEYLVKPVLKLRHEAFRER